MFKKFSSFPNVRESYLCHRDSFRTEASQTLYFLQIRLIEENFATGGLCGKCLFWRIASAITWGNFFTHGKNIAHLIETGTWMPVLGANLTDAIFPHVTHGFRGISLPVATYHVRKAYSTSLLRRDLDNSVLPESAVADRLVDQLWREGVRRAGLRRHKISRAKIELHLYRDQPAEQSDCQVHS